MRTKLQGEVSEYGYTLWKLDGKTGLTSLVYRAGNSKFESTATVQPGSKSALSIETLKAFCDQTGEDTAEEMGAEYVGHTVAKGV